MAGFTDLVAAAQPALVQCDAAGTEGRSWRWQIDGFVDGTGAPVDLTAATVTCKVLTKVDGVTVLTLTGVGSSGSVLLTATPAATAGLAGGLTKRACRWSCTVTLAGSQVQVWGPSNSRFYIEAE